MALHGRVRSAISLAIAALVLAVSSFCSCRPALAHEHDTRAAHACCPDGGQPRSHGDPSNEGGCCSHCGNPQIGAKWVDLERPTFTAVSLPAAALSPDLVAPGQSAMVAAGPFYADDSPPRMPVLLRTCALLI